MDTNTDNAIYHLMQNVIDKLDVIEKKINDKENLNKAENKSNDAKALKTIIENSTTSIQKSLKTSQDEMSKNLMSINEQYKVIPNVNHYKEFSLFGKQSHVKPIKVYYALIGLVFVWFSIKYLPH